jgi:Flp pilus assembly pilin Flp
MQRVEKALRDTHQVDSTALLLGQFMREEDGQDVVEYGLLIATIAIVVLLATSAFGSQISTWFGRLAGRITTTVT